MGCVRRYFRQSRSRCESFEPQMSRDTWPSAIPTAAHSWHNPLRQRRISMGAQHIGLSLFFEELDFSAWV